MSDAAPAPDPFADGAFTPFTLLAWTWYCDRCKADVHVNGRMEERSLNPLGWSKDGVIHMVLYCARCMHKIATASRAQPTPKAGDAVTRTSETHTFPDAIIP